MAQRGLGGDGSTANTLLGTMVVLLIFATTKNFYVAVKHVVCWAVFSYATLSDNDTNGRRSYARSCPCLVRDDLDRVCRYRSASCWGARRSFGASGPIGRRRHTLPWGLVLGFKKVKENR